MNEPPRLATALLEHLAPGDQAFIGDLQENCRRGQSTVWYWRQTVLFLVNQAIRQTASDPLRSLQAIVVGWGVLALAFGLLGDRIAYGLSAVLHPGWTHAGAYQTHIWWPFDISSAFVSYAGFALSGWIVGRLHRGSLLLIHILSVWVAIAGATTAIQLYARPVAVAHPLFYLIAIALPYRWHSGLLLVPLTMLIAGMLASRGPRRAAVA